MTSPEEKLKNRAPLKSSENKRPKRVPLDQQKKIGIEKDGGYYYRLVNDDGDRIARFKKAGYEIVEAPIREGETSSSQASQLGKEARQSVGNGMEAVYMRIPLSEYEADKDRQQAELDRRDKEIGRDKIPGAVRRGKIEIDYGPLKR